MPDNFEKKIASAVKKLKKISQVEAPRASAWAMNRVMSSEKTRTVRSVSKAESIPAKIIRKYVYMSKATAAKQISKVTFYSRPVPVVSLIKTSILLERRTRGTNRKGVKAAKRQFDGSFINLVRKSGRFQVLHRKTKKREPIDVTSIDINSSSNKAVGENPKKVQVDYKEALFRDLQRRINKLKV